MKYKLKVYSIWELGQRKDAEGNPHQEDSLYPPFGKATDADRMFILCDGMGGHEAGEVASATVCEAMSEAIRNNGHDAEGTFTEKDLSNAIAAAYDALDRKDNGAEKKMGTTMTFLKFHNEGATIAHIGDSRVYHIRPGKTGEETRILHETEDHSLVNDLIKIGELTREEARFSKQKNVITRAMQPNQERRAKANIYHTADIRPGDYFYLCSDGMLEQPDMEDGSVLKRIFSDEGETDEHRVEILRGATAENRDNHTAFVIHVLEVIDSVNVIKEPIMPTKKMAVVKKSPSVTPKIFTGIVILALCLLGIRYLKSCISIPKEKTEKLQDNPTGTGGRVTGKPTPSPASPPALPTSTAEQPQTEPDKRPATPSQDGGQPSGNSDLSLPADLSGVSSEGVVDSDQQIATGAIRNEIKSQN